MMNKTKGYIVGQLNTLKRKREIETPIESDLSRQTIANTEKAKRILTSLMDKKQSGPLYYQAKINKKVLQ